MGLSCGSELVPSENEGETAARADPGQLSRHLPAPTLLYPYRLINLFLLLLCVMLQVLDMSQFLINWVYYAVAWSWLL